VWRCYSGGHDSDGGSDGSRSFADGSTGDGSPNYRRSDDKSDDGNPGNDDCPKLDPESRRNGSGNSYGNRLHDGRDPKDSESVRKEGLWQDAEQGL